MKRSAIPKLSEALGGDYSRNIRFRRRTLFMASLLFLPATSRRIIWRRFAVTLSYLYMYSWISSYIFCFHERSITSYFTVQDSIILIAYLLPPIDGSGIGT